MPINRSLPVPPPEPAFPSTEVLALRTCWKWAYLSHFLFTYNPVLHLEDIQLSELEDDLAAGTFDVIPTVMQRLLMCLTPHDKRMILEDWQHQLRKQTLRRAPDHNPMGTEDGPVDFTSLIMSDKLNLFQALCEWQFHNPNSLRARMRDDDEYASWRMEPIAYDAKGNAYWLMGGNRLWIQYAPPRKRTVKSHKRKQTAPASTRKPAKRRLPAATSSSKANANTTTNAKHRASTSRPTSGRSLRETRSKAGTSTQSKLRTMGTRVSSRLRGREEEEIWQPIPEEWLKEQSKGDTPEISDEDQRTGKFKGNEEGSKKQMALKSLDDVSELTSLSDLSELPEGGEEEEDVNQEEEEEDSTPTPPPDFSSSNEEVWETVCVTLAEWEAFPRRFEKSIHRGEKAFYKLLTNDLVPMITEVLRVDVRKKVMEDAVVHRKRSSRIAVKESVREAERAEARRKAEEEKEMERHRRWEARARKDEEDRIKRENMRSARLREKGRTGSESMDVDVVGGVSEGRLVLVNGNASERSTPAAAPVKFVVNVSKSGTQTPKDDEPWELDCEMCHRRGMNLDEGQELMCCERCNKWQHIRCHDQADFIAGRPRRNWELEDFLCSVCAIKGRKTPQGTSLQHQPHAHNNLSPAQVWRQYNGTLATSYNGVVPVQPQSNHRKPAPTTSAPKQGTYEVAASHSNGRTIYNHPQSHGHTQPPYAPSAGPLAQYPHRSQPPTTAQASTGYPSQTRVSAPYASAPNMYLSNYSSNPRPPQSPGTLSQPTPAALSPYYRTTIPPAQTGSLSQQQQQYSHLTNQQPWNGTIHGSETHSYTALGVTQPVQQNGYYRPHPVAPSNALTSQNHLPNAQHYFASGPSPQ